MRPERILIIRTDRIGDVVLSTPAIKALRDSYPRSYIAFMVRPYARDIVEGNPYLDEVIIYDKYGAHRGFFSTILFALRLRKKRFDTAIILHPTNRAHMVAFIAGIPERIGFDRKLPFLLTKALNDKKFLGQKHELEYTLEILKSIGVDAHDKALFVPVKKEGEDSVSSKLAEKGAGETELLIGVHPGASCPSKRWPANRFASLVNRLADNYDARIVLLSAPEETAHAAKVRKQSSLPC
jgi:heptosyltransferase-2